MSSLHSVDFFDRQFQRQIAEGDHALNPFERATLPHLRGRVLDFGCGLGHLALEAARRGCEVEALDASASAIAHLRAVAAREALPLRATEAELRERAPDGRYDAVVCIGLLMFFDCASAWRQLDALQAATEPGGVLALNVLIEGTTFMGMFGPEGHCLFEPGRVLERFAGWERLHEAIDHFEAPGGTRKRFLTLIARRPLAPWVHGAGAGAFSRPGCENPAP